MCKTIKEKKTSQAKVTLLFNVEGSTNLFANPLYVSIAEENACFESKKWDKKCETSNPSDKGSSRNSKPQKRGGIEDTYTKRH